MAIRDEIAALYEGILGRPADQAGLDYFTNAVTSGAGTLADVARDMRASAEVQGSRSDELTQDGIGKYSYNPSGTYEAISNLYQKILGRQPDQAGLDYFTKAVMTRQGTLADVERDLRASAEAQGLLGGSTTKTTTNSALTTNAGANGLLGGTQSMTADAARSFVGSLYNNILLRQGEQGGMDYWTGLLTSGRATPAEVEAAIRGSAESQGVQIGTRQVPFGSQAVGGNVYQMAQYNAPRNLPPSIQSAFQQSLDYQAALPYMIPQFNPADIPATYQQIAQPRQRLDISNITVPEWLKEAAKKDQAATEEAAGEKTAEKAVENAVTTGGVTTTNVGSQQTAAVPSWITNAYAQYLGRPAEAAGANYWAQQAAAGVPIADLVATIAASPEAQGLLGK
jgi:hypothetical protein